MMSSERAVALKRELRVERRETGSEGHSDGARGCRMPATSNKQWRRGAAHIGAVTHTFTDEIQVQPDALALVAHNRSRTHRPAQRLPTQQHATSIVFLVATYHSLLATRYSLLATCYVQ